MTYFSPSEFACKGGHDCTAPPPHEYLLAQLEILRSRVGRVVTVTSGSRCPAYNVSVGGKPDSAHLTGEGADLAAFTSRERWELLNANWAAGPPLFTRLGVGKTFLHVDVKTDPPRVVWHYY